MFSTWHISNKREQIPRNFLEKALVFGKKNYWTTRERFKSRKLKSEKEVTEINAVRSHKDLFKCKML